MLMLPKDLKEAAAIERRRRLDNERKARIFNRRNLVIGIDKEALDKQVFERRQREQDERDRDAAMEKQRVRDAEVALMIEKRIEEERRLHNMELNNFRSVYQKKESRREFDLYDPDRLKKQLPGRLCDDDPRLGLSSVQKFEGEDLSSGQRSKYQHEQIRSWLEQQMEERRAADADRRAAELEYDAGVLDRDLRAVQLDLLEQSVRKKIEEANKSFNKHLAEETESRRVNEEAREWEINKAEMFNAQTGDFLTENPECHKSALGLNRVVGFMYRGMTEEERMEVRKYQQQQAEEKRKAQALEAQRDADWEKLSRGLAEAAIVQEREFERNQRKINEAILQENKELAKQQTSKKQYFDEVVFTNQPTAAYYEQFNTTGR